MFILKQLGAALSVLTANNNFSKIEGEVNSNLLKLSPEDGQNNTMDAQLDMGGNDIINAGVVAVQGLSIKGEGQDEWLDDVRVVLEQVGEARDDAEVARDEAEGFAQSAAQSAQDAQNIVNQGSGLPDIHGGDGLKVVRVNNNETSYELHEINEELYKDAITQSLGFDTELIPSQAALNLIAKQFFAPGLIYGGSLKVLDYLIQWGISEEIGKDGSEEIVFANEYSSLSSMGIFTQMIWTAPKGVGSKTGNVALYVRNPSVSGFTIDRDDHGTTASNYGGSKAFWVAIGYSTNSPL